MKPLKLQYMYQLWLYHWGSSRHSLKMMMFQVINNDTLCLTLLNLPIETQWMFVAQLGKEGFRHDGDLIWKVATHKRRVHVLRDLVGVDKEPYENSWMRNNLAKNSTLEYYVKKKPRGRREEKHKLRKIVAMREIKQDSFPTWVIRMWMGFFENKISRVTKCRNNQGI